MLYSVLLVSYISFASSALKIKPIPKEKPIVFSLAQFNPPVIPPPKPLVQKVQKVEKILPKKQVKKVLPKAMPIAKPMIQKKVKKSKKIKKKRIVKKKITKKKIRKKKIVKKIKSKKKNQKTKIKKIHKKTQKKIKQKSTKRKSTKIHKKKRKQTKAKKPKNNKAKKNKFLGQLRAKIMANKIYPRMAQRRGMQGTVSVKFTILANGHVSNIRLSGPKVFYKSVRNAIKKAFPISTANKSFTLPLTLNVDLHYRLR